VIGLLASFAGFFVNKEQFAHSWLFACFYFFALTCGSLFWILVHHGTDAEWSVVVRRLWETKASLVWLPFVFLLPLFLPFTGLTQILWHWWTVPYGTDHILDLKRGYLNHTFFWVRVVLFCFGLTWVAARMLHWSTKQDADGAHSHTKKMRVLAFAGLPIFGVSLTFAAIDWLMAMDHHWFSTMWGVYIFAGTAGSAMALTVLSTTWLRSQGYLKPVTIQHYHVMGKFLLAFTVFWAYIGFSQYMLIWYANIPEETIYFVRRNTGSWRDLSFFLVAFRFFVPFPLLLLQLTKKTPKFLCFVAGWILFMQVIDLYIIVLPMLHPTGISVSWMDVTSWVGIGGLMVFAFLKKLGKHALMPVRDPRGELSANTTN
jgi:hypothetical protein